MNKSMKHICTIYTEGGPAAIMCYRGLRSWDGREDYADAISALAGKLSTVLRREPRNQDVCLVHQESDGNFHIFAADDTVLILSEIYAEPGYELCTRLPDLVAGVQAVTPQVIEWPEDKVAIIDAAMPGHCVQLNDVGCEQILYDRNAPDHHSVAVIAVLPGTWEMLEILVQSQVVSCVGIMLRRIEHRIG